MNKKQIIELIEDRAKAWKYISEHNKFIKKETAQQVQFELEDLAYIIKHNGDNLEDEEETL